MRPPPIPLHLTGVILAAESSTAPGRDKALLTLPNGTTLVAHQAAVLRKLPVNDLLISARPHVDYGVAGAHRIYDRIPELGPISALEAAYEHSSQPHLLLLAIDLHKITADLLRRLYGTVSPDTGAVPIGPRGCEPLCAIYPRNPVAVAAMNEALNARNHSIHELVETGLAQGWMRPWNIPGPDLAAFEPLGEVRAAVYAATAHHG